ncbi:MAG: cellulase family glycosylhydrolase [Thermoleophilaceae bacterium]
MIACAAFFSAAAPAMAAKFMVSVMQDDNQLIYSSAANRDVALRRMKVLGVDAIRVSVLWNAVAPRKKISRGQDPRAYRTASWDRYDDVLRAAQRYGLIVYFDVTPPGPRWTQGKANDPANQRAWKPNTKQFGRFYQAVARRYSGTYHDENEGRGVLPRVSWWGIGNEPNQGGWLMPQARKIGGHVVPTSPAIYRDLLVAGADALIRTGHAQDTINMGETAPLGVAPVSERRPLRPALFLRELFCLDGRLHPYRGAAARARNCGSVKKLAILSRLPRLVYAHHPYTKRLPPTKRDKSRDAITVANLRALPALLDNIAKRTKLLPVGLPIVLTEFGYETNPPDPLNGIPLDTQAEWNNLGDYAAYRSERVFANTQFLLFDVAPLKQYPRNSKAYWFTYQSGLLTTAGRAKPSAFAYMMPFVAKPAGGGNYAFWGDVRFTPNGANQSVYLQFREGGGDWQTAGDVINVTNSVGFWEASRSAHKGQTWRAVWTSPDFSDFRLSREIPLK